MAPAADPSMGIFCLYPGGTTPYVNRPMSSTLRPCIKSPCTSIRQTGGSLKNESSNKPFTVLPTLKSDGDTGYPENELKSPLPERTKIGVVLPSTFT